MSAVPAFFPPQQVYRFTVDKYHRMIEDGVLGEDDPVELIEGVIVFKMPKSEDHILSVRQCRRVFERMLPDDFFYDAEQPVVLPDGEPEPDGVIVWGSYDDRRSAKPTAENLVLVIEVAETSLDRDRNAKLRSYARAGIAQYWIVNLADRQVEFHSDPDRVADPFPAYRQRVVYAAGQSAPLTIAGRHVADVPVDSLLPPLSA